MKGILMPWTWGIPVMGSGGLICTKGCCKEDIMEPRKLLDTLAVADRLKDTTRHCYTAGGRHESVAEHS